jgi:hypothetical protein
MNVPSAQNKQVIFKFKYKKLLVNKNILPLCLLLRANEQFEFRATEGVDYDKLLNLLNKWFSEIEIIEN